MMDCWCSVIIVWLPSDSAPGFGVPRAATCSYSQREDPCTMHGCLTEPGMSANQSEPISPSQPRFACRRVSNNSYVCSVASFAEYSRENTPNNQALQHTSRDIDRYTVRTTSSSPLASVPKAFTQHLLRQ